MEQRKDTVKRQLEKYNHACCKNCFGKEQTFRDARKRVMTENNSFKGKSHSEIVKNKLSELRIGIIPWNKGLTKETNNSVKKYGKSISLFRKINSLSGDKNPNWKGGISSSKEYRSFDDFKNWVGFRTSILERDFYKCWKCNSHKNLEVHHLLSRKKYPEFEKDGHNCIVLCSICHKEFHKKYGRKNFTRVDTLNWIDSFREDNQKLIRC